MDEPVSPDANDELDHVESLAHTYFTVQIPFDKRLIGYGHQTLKPFFQGPEALELGSGDGDMTDFLVEDFERITVVDGSQQLLDGMNDAPNLVKVHSLFEEYEPEVQFNTIIMAHILEHIQDPPALLARAKEWLAPGGRILAIVPNALSFHRLLAVHMGMLDDVCQLNERDHAVGHRRVYTPTGFRADFEAAGLDIVEQGGIFFKALSNGQLQDQWTDEMIDACYEVGKDLPDNAAEIYVVAGVD